MLSSFLKEFRSVWLSSWKNVPMEFAETAIVIATHGGKGSRLFAALNSALSSGLTGVTMLTMLVTTSLAAISIGYDTVLDENSPLQVQASAFDSGVISDAEGNIVLLGGTGQNLSLIELLNTLIEPPEEFSLPSLQNPGFFNDHSVITPVNPSFADDGRAPPQTPINNEPNAVLTFNPEGETNAGEADTGETDAGEADAGETDGNDNDNGDGGDSQPPSNPPSNPPSTPQTTEISITSITPLTAVFGETPIPGEIVFGGLPSNVNFVRGEDYNATAAFTGDTNAGSGRNYTITVNVTNPAFTLSNNTVNGTDGIIHRASGLSAIPPESIRVLACDVDENSFDLSYIALNFNDYGTRSLSVRYFNDPSGILIEPPVLNGNILTFQGAGRPTGTAVKEIIISTTNYEDIIITKIFIASEKNNVSDFINFANGNAIYNRATNRHNREYYGGLYAYTRHSLQRDKFKCGGLDIICVYNNRAYGF
jgi:hypothetical protein